MQSLPGSETRWQLYRLLSDPVRLRLLALAAEGLFVLVQRTSTIRTRPS